MEGVILKILSLFILVFYLHNVDSAPRAKRRRKLLSYSITIGRDFKRAAGYHEDAYLNFTELTTKYQYPSEEHTVVTGDGYILTLFRILPKCDKVNSGFPVILMHGIFDTADCWILPGPETGLGYVLANNCYDVWAANHRGNFYSRKHMTLNPDKDPEYWDYTFDEHGYYDVTAIVDYVLKTTLHPKVSYIGHSQGTTDFFVMASLRPEYNDKIQTSFQLAPVAWMKNIASPLPKLLAPASKTVKTFLDGVGFQELFAKHQLTHALVEFLCQIAPNEVCGTGLFLSTGYKIGNISPRTLAVAFGHLLAGLSTKDLVHLSQLINTGRFQRFDEGRNGNIKRYGSPTPPDYDVSRITSPVVLICARNDWLSSLKDVETLNSKLPNILENYIVPNPDFSHNDHIYGNDAPKYVFKKILDYLPK